MTVRIIHTTASVTNLSAGPTYSVTGLARSQGAQGAQVAVYSIGAETTVSGAGFADRRFANTYSGVPVLGRLGMSKAMRLAMHMAPPEIVHTHGLWMMPNIYRTPNSAFVIAPRGMLTDVALSFSPYRKRLFGIMAQYRALADAVLFHATAESEYEDIRRFGLRQPVAIIPNGIDLPDLTYLRPNATGGTVLSLGRIHPKKALDVLIKAWASIEPDFPQWRLRIVGPEEGGHAAQLAELLHMLGLRTVSIEPPVFGAEKSALMAGANVFALPSHSENFGMTVAESLAAGVPVISSKGAPWGGLETHRCGWWIDHGSDTLAATLRIALSLPEAERQAMGARGRAWMERDFSWDRMAQMSLRAYAWVLGRGDRPECVCEA